MKFTHYFHLGFAALVLLMFGALCATDARADTLGFTAPGGSIATQTPNGAVDLGMVFTANSTFSVDALGIYDLSNLTGSEQVGLYNSSGTLLASATVTLTDPVTNGYLFQSITPVTLTAGSTYTVDAYVGSNPWAIGPAPTTPSSVTFKYNDYLYSGGLAFPTTTGGAGPAYYGPNFEIGTGNPDPPPVPEPSGFAFVTLAVLAGCLYLRKQRSMPAANGITSASI